MNVSFAWRSARASAFFHRGLVQGGSRKGVEQVLEYFHLPHLSFLLSNGEVSVLRVWAAEPFQAPESAWKLCGASVWLLGPFLRPSQRLIAAPFWGSDSGRARSRDPAPPAR